MNRSSPAHAPAQPDPPAFSLRALHRRACVDTWLKALGTAVGMSAFFVGYFALLRAPAFPVLVMPRTWLDHALPFQPWALLPYASLWLNIALVPAFLVDRGQLWSFAFGCLGLSLAGYAVFYFLPTAIPAPDIDWNLYPAFLFLKNTDLAGNACPSLHVAFAVFTALWFERILPSLGGGRVARAANLLWAALIAYSTLGTRQHVALDVYWGGALGAWAASLNLIATPCREPQCATPRPLLAAVAVIKACAVLLWTAGAPTAWCVALFFSGGALVLWHLFVPGAQGLVRVATRFKPSTSDAREVWLTLDDGPDPDDTPRILDLLDQHQARATFFLVGERAARHPALVAEIARRGHEIAHHTHTHPVADFWSAGPARLHRELDDALAAFASALPAGAPPPRRFRAPVGIKNLLLAPALAARGLVCVGWSIRSLDTLSRDPAKVAARVARRLRPGAIILLHEGPPLRPEVRVAALAHVLDDLRAAGYRAVVPDSSKLL
jgi:peptidoglycan-N-acetylglucosamine deacetylase